MNIEILSSSLEFIKPEIALSLTLVLIVVIDLIMGNNKKLLPYAAILGLLITAYFTAEQFGMSAFAFVSPPSTAGLLSIDAFGAFFKTVVILTSIFIVLFSLSSSEIISCDDRHGEYYTLILGMTLGMFLMSSATDLILIYLSVELLSLSSYVLAGFVKTVKRDSEASLKYIIYGGVASGIMLFGISIIFGLTGNTNLFLINAVMQTEQLSGFTYIFAGMLVLGGLGFKVSVAPFHFWTPDVYEGAPITITAFLSVASKAAGFALLIRFIKITFFDTVTADGYWILLNIIDWESILVLLAILTMSIGNFTAIWQDNLKRMLAYSSIAHAGYLLLAVAVLSNEGLVAVLFYFATYLFMNLGAFFVVMLIANKTGSEDIDDYKGLGSAIPFLGVALSIFLLGLAGLPPTAGFIGKLYIFIALVDANMIVAAVIALLNTVVAYYYYVRVLKNLYLVKVETERKAIKFSPANIVLTVILLIPVFLFGIYFTPLVDLAKTSIAMIGF